MTRLYPIHHPWVRSNYPTIYSVFNPAEEKGAGYKHFKQMGLKLKARRNA